MKIAIVGTSELTITEKLIAKSVILRLVTPGCNNEVITGDARGIDELVREMANDKEFGFHIKIYDSETRDWAGFKDRNKKIAQEADEIISITTREIKTEKCYHCNEEHQRTGGCWTLKYGKSIGKQGEVIVI